MLANRKRNLRNMPTSYGEAAERLADKDTRCIAHNTALVTLANDCIGLILHSTIVVRWFADGRIVFNTGGWRTVTTKQRINHVAKDHGYAVGSVKRVWHVFDFTNCGAHDRRPSREFSEGFTIQARPIVWTGEKWEVAK